MKREARNKSNSLWSLLFPFIAIFIAVWFLVTASSYKESWSFDVSKLNAELRDSIFSLERHHEIINQKNIDGKINPRHKTRKWILKNASTEDLQILKNYPSGVVKATAFEILIHREKGNQYNLFMEAFQDTTHFLGTSSGCLGYTKMVGEYLYEDLLIHYLHFGPAPIIQERYQLNIKQIENIESSYKKQQLKKRAYYKQSLN